MAVSIAQANAMLGGLSATLYVQAHTGDPGAAGTANTIGGSTRGTVSMAAASGGTRSASGSSDCRSIPLGTTVTHVSYWDAPASGAFQFSEELASSVSFLYAGTLRLTAQTFTLSTSASGSQTVTSNNADTTSASDSNASQFIARHTDSTTSADVVSAAVGVFSANSDTTTSSDSHSLVIGLAITDTGTSASDSNSAEVPDGTSPTISSFSVPATDTDTSLTGISAAATDNVGVTGWVIKDVAGGAGAPTATAAECTQTAGISADALSSSTLTHTAGGTGARDCYLFVRDLAGNVTRSTVSTCTISAGGFSDNFGTNSLSSYTQANACATYGISGGVLTSTHVDSSGGGTLTRTGVSGQDGTVSVKVRFSTGSGGSRKAGMAARLGTGASRIMAMYSTATGVLAAYSWTSGGGWVQIGSNYNAGNPGTTQHTLSMTLSGTSVSLSLDGTERVTGTTSLNQTGEWGIYDEGAGYLDESEIWTPSDYLIEFDDLAFTPA